MNTRPRLYTIVCAQFGKYFANIQPKKYYGGPKAFRMAGKVDKSKRYLP